MIYLFKIFFFETSKVFPVVTGKNISGFLIVLRGVWSCRESLWMSLILILVCIPGIDLLLRCRWFLNIRTLAGFRGSRGSRGSRGCKKYNESLTQEKYFFWLIFFCYAFMYCAQHRQTLSFPLYLIWVLGLRSQSRANLEILRFWVRKIFWNLGPRNYSYL